MSIFFPLFFRYLILRLADISTLLIFGSSGLSIFRSFKASDLLMWSFEASDLPIFRSFRSSDLSKLSIFRSLEASDKKKKKNRYVPLALIYDTWRTIWCNRRRRTGGGCFPKARCATRWTVSRTPSPRGRETPAGQWHHLRDRSVFFCLAWLGGRHTEKERKRVKEREKGLNRASRAYHFISMLRLAHPAVYETNGKSLSNGWFMISSDWREG